LEIITALTGIKKKKNLQTKNWDKIIIIIIIIIIIGIQPLGRPGQRPEFSQATGMALVRYILGKFLGVACHCFPPFFLDVPTFHHQVTPRPPRRERSQRRK